MKNKKKDFADKCKENRIALNLSTKEVAEILEISEEKYKSFEKTGNLELPLMEKLAKMLVVKLDKKDFDDYEGIGDLPQKIKEVTLSILETIEDDE